MEKILTACAKHGVAIELNAISWWLDLDWRWCECGLELGCLFSIDPDAHSTDEVDHVGWGVLNALSRDHFAAHLEQRKRDSHKRRPKRRRKTG